MSNRVRDVAGATAAGETPLGGAVDGANAVYTTSAVMNLALPVMVYRNGLCKVASLDDGYFIQDNRTVVFKEPPQSVDTVAVSYVPAANLTLAAIGTPTALSVTIDQPGSGSVTLRLKSDCRRRWRERDCAEEDSMGYVTLPNGGTVLPPGMPVTVDDTGHLMPADAAAGSACEVYGVTQLGAQPWASYVRIVTDGGLALGVLNNYAPRARIYLAVGGGVTLTPPAVSGAAVYFLGFAANSTDMMVQLRLQAVRS